MKNRKRGSEFSPIQGAISFLVAISLAFSGSVYANPSGGVIVHGDIQIAQNGSTLQVIQGTSHGIIDWTSFSIASGETTQFIQPGASSVTLNRVTGGATSFINGSLLANGRVFLLNSAGVVVGQGGVVDTAGFTASTLDLSNEAFLRGGDLNFRGNSQAGIVNLGSIHAVEGDVFLIAASVVNEGSISAPQGTVGLAGGNDVLIAESGSERVFVRGSGSANGRVVNRGVVQANVAELKAHGGNIYGMAVRNNGRVAATSVSREGGQIFLRAGGGGGVRTTGTLTAKREQGGGDVVVDSGAAGETEVSGVVEAAGTSGDGGTILVFGNRINVLEGSLMITDGDSGGGRILLGGGRRGLNPDFTNAESVQIGDNVSLQASARKTGDGGEIITFASGELNFAGRAIARGGSENGDGGFVEVSGQESLLIGSLSRQIDVGASSGFGGTLLIDPTDILIVDALAGEVSTIGSNVIADQDIVDFLDGDPGNLESNGANLQIVTTEGEGFGDIAFQGDVNISWNSGSMFSLEADRDILVASGAIVAAGGDGSINFNADRDVEVGGQLSSKTGGVRLKGASLDLLPGGTIGNTLTTGNIELRTDSIELAGTVQSSGILTIAPLTSNRAINLGAGTPTTGLQLSSAELGQLQDGFTSVVYGDESNGSGIIRIGTATFTDPTTFATPVGGTEASPGGEIFVEGNLTGTGNASFVFDGSGPAFGGFPATTYLSGSIMTSGGDIIFADDVKLMEDVSLTTTNGTFGNGNIFFDGTVENGNAADPARLFVDGGPNGAVSFSGGAGATSPFSEAVILGGSIWFNGTLRAAGEVFLDANRELLIGIDFQTREGGISSLGGPVTLRGGQSVEIFGPNTSITTGGETIFIEGNSGETFNPSIFSGVVIQGAEIDAAGGDILIFGRAGGSGDDSSGVEIVQSAIRTEGEGLVNIFGDGGFGAGDRLSGVVLANNSSVTSADGDISIVGFGGGDGTGENGSGVSLDGVAVESSNDVYVEGNANAGMNGTGISLSGSSLDSVGGGDIDLIGNGSVGDGSVGLLMTSGMIGGPSSTSEIEIIADTINLAGGLIQSSGSLTLASFSLNASISLGSGVPDIGFQLNNDEIGRLADGFSSIVIGDTAEGSGPIMIGTVQFSDPTTFATPNPGGEIFLDGILSGVDDASFFFDGSGPNFEGVASTTYLNGTISTQGQQVRISDDVVLRGDSWIDTTAGGQMGGANVVIEGTVRGETEARDFTVDAGSNGQIFFWDSVGSGPGTTLIGDIDWSAGRLNLDSGIYSAGGMDIVTAEYFVLGNQGVLNSTNHLTIKANQGASPVSGDFSGILSSGQITSTSGEIILEGRAGDSLEPAGPNLGVWLRDGSDLMASEGIRIVGAAPNGVDYGVQLDATISSLNGIVKVGSLGGDVQINNTVSGTGLELLGAPQGNTTFQINGVVPLFGLSADGGGGMNTLDFGGYTGNWLEVGAEQLMNIDYLIGRADLLPAFFGSDAEAGRFSIDRTTGFIYEDDTRGMIDVTDFSEVIGGSFDDFFTIDLGTSNVFDGSLDGDRGNDTFTFLSGSVDSIFESDFTNGEIDLIDFSAVGAALEVTLETGEAVFGTESTTFSGIERVIGPTGFTNRIEGTDGDDTLLITGNGRGEIQSTWNDFDQGPGLGDFTEPESTLFIENEEEFELDGPPDMRTVAFENFALVSGGRGADSFEVSLPTAEDFEGQLLGGEDADTFFVMPGGSIATVNGEGGIDTLDFSSFSTPVFVELQNSSATQVGSFSSIESLVGGSNDDTLTGTPQSDQFLVTEENGGFLNSGSFRDFEILNGIGGGDFFTFQNQANVLRFDGGSEIDTFTLDDRNLSEGQSYSISGNTVSSNPTYEFMDIEFLELLLGSGNDTVLAGSNGTIQFVDGGGGFDTVDFGSTPVVGGNPFLFGGSQLFSSNVEEFVFVRDESNNPDNIDNDRGGNPNSPGDGTVSDQFSGGGLADAAANAFSAFAANALITGQAVVIQLDGERFQLQAPASLDGFFTEPPQSIIGQLQKNLEVDAWAELANAIDFSDSTILLRNDGPFAISLDGLPPQDIIAILEGSLLVDPARELVAALEMTLVIPVTSIDGAVSIVAIPIQVDQATLALLQSNLNEGAFNELTEALDQ